MDHEEKLQPIKDKRTERSEKNNMLMSFTHITLSLLTVLNIWEYVNLKLVNIFIDKAFIAGVINVQM